MLKIGRGMSHDVQTKLAISELPCASVSKQVQVQNLSYENEFDLHLNELVSKTDFHMKGFALELVLKQRQRELGNGLFVDAKKK